MMDNPALQKLPKAQADIQIDHVTRYGSAFALCENGDKVFLHARLVEKMNLDEGDVCHAILLANYANKREVTPWRGVWVSNV